MTAAVQLSDGVWSVVVPQAVSGHTSHDLLPLVDSGT